MVVKLIITKYNISYKIPPKNLTTKNPNYKRHPLENSSRIHRK